MTAQTQKKLRNLLVKKPFYRLLPQTPTQMSEAELHDLGERRVIHDGKLYIQETQADYQRQLDPNAHAINDPHIYINYVKGSDGLYYEQDFPRYAFAYQQEILDDRLARTTGNDIQFDLADKVTDEETQRIYDLFKAGWADKRMENAWHFAIKSDYSVADTAFVGVLTKATFSWKILSYNDGDTLYPHYDRVTGDLNIFARTYTSEDDEGNNHNYIDVWDDKFYYRLVDYIPSTEDEKQENTEEKVLETLAGNFDMEGYILEDKRPHGFGSIPVAYHRRNDGPVWSPSQETIEHREASFSRLAQNNHDFGLPIMYLKGKGKQITEIATKDMSYASKIFIIPENGEAGFLSRQDASGAYKTELDMLEDKIYSQSMVVKAPELKSGDTPAAAIKLLYSDAYNKAMLEIQEYDAFVCKMIDIFKYGYGIETQQRLGLMNTRISFFITPFLPINDAEVTTNLAMAVQNGFCSKQTASERFYFSTPQEYERCLKEKHEEQMQELLVEEQRLDIQSEQQVETQEQLADIQADQQIEVIKAQNNIEKASANDDDNKPRKVRPKKGKVSTGRSVGRPRTVNTDQFGNRIGENNWDRFDEA